MRRHAVVIAGAGPTGLMLAGELALAGVDVAAVERRPGQALDGYVREACTRAPSRSWISAELRDRFLSRGRAAQGVSFSGIPSDLSDFPTRHNYVLALWQGRFEEILAAWVDELDVPIYRRREVTGFAQDDERRQGSCSMLSSTPSGWMKMGTFSM